MLRNPAAFRGRTAQSLYVIVPHLVPGIALGIAAAPSGIQIMLAVAALTIIASTIGLERVND